MTNYREDRTWIYLSGTQKNGSGRIAKRMNCPTCGEVEHQTDNPDDQAHCPCVMPTLDGPIMLDCDCECHR